MARTSYLADDPRTGKKYEANPPVVPDNDRRLDAALSGERGSLWDQTRLFEWYESGLIFLRGPVEDFEIEAMLRTDGKARACEQVITLPVRGAKWELQQGDAETPVMDYCQQLITAPADQGGMSTPLQQVIAQAAMACLYRSACFEKVVDLNSDGMVVYKKIAYRPPTTCYLARDAKTAQLRGFLQWTWTDIASFQKIYIPAAKAWTYLHGTHRDPILGSSDMEVVYRSFELKQKLRYLWMAYMENQVTPKGLAKVASGDDQAAASFAKRASTLHGGGVIGLTENESLEPYEPKSDGGNTFAQAIAYLDEEMYSALLANFLGLATASGVRGGGGSYALSLSQTDFYLQSRWAVLVEMAESFTHNVLAPMVRWNFGHQARVPRFHFSSLAPTSNTAEAIVQMVASLLTAVDQSGQPAAVPPEFIAELVNSAGTQIGLDSGTIHDATKRHLERVRQQEGDSPSAPLHAAVDVLHAAARGRAAA